MFSVLTNKLLFTFNKYILPYYIYYPNPSRDIFNVTFTSEDIQNLEVRIINVIGEVVYTENLEQFVGQYTKQVDLATYTKGVYFLEITTDNGVINKKLILQ